METTQIYEQNIFQLQKQVQELMIRISVLNKEKLVLEELLDDFKRRKSNEYDEQLAVNSD